MDAQAKKKALFRAKLNAQKKEKRIESPIVRYNEFDQPVCRVCDVVLKHESNWDAHQISRKHREAISNLKANAAGLAQQSHSKPVTDTKLPKIKPEHASESQSKIPNNSQESLKPPPSSALPPDFFDNNDARKPRSEKDSGQLGDPNSNKRTGVSAQSQALNSEKVKGALHSSNAVQPKGSQEAMETKQTSSTPADTEAKQVKGVLPEGFFDNKEADLRARGIKPVKPDVKDEYKEFEKLIQDDLQEVDDRFEEEEIDAAEMIEEAETVEQRNNRERVEKLRKRRLELKAAKANDEKRSKTSEAVMESKHDDPSSDDDSDDDFAVDWRAQHL